VQLRDLIDIRDLHSGNTLVATCFFMDAFHNSNQGAYEAAMLEFLPKEVREGLEAARKRDHKRKSRLRVEVGDAVYPVLRFWQDGFALDADFSPGKLRGLVDVYDGSRHVFQCLIMASSIENGELVCDFKRATAVTGRAPLDFWRDENAPVGYLPRP
jgi:hypothetical protein